MTDARSDFLMLTMAQVREAAVPLLVVLSGFQSQPPAQATPEALRAALKTTWS